MTEELVAFASTSDTAARWDLLASAVKERREQLRLPQDLVNEGGPSEFTVRKIERAETTAIRNKTKTQLEQALQWPRGRVDDLLTGHDPADEEPDWTALASEVQRRRVELRLRQSDLEAHGGPSAATVRNIEQASRTSYTARTFMQLETALQWPRGHVDDLLAGTATDDEAASCGDLRRLAHHGGPSSRAVRDIEAARLEPITEAGTAARFLGGSPNLPSGEAASPQMPGDDARALRVGRLVLALIRELAD